MGLLTAAQKLAIPGARTRQRWRIGVPISAGSGSYDWKALGDTDSGEYNKRVVDAGSRDVSAYNISFAEPGKMRVASYTFVCSNDDERLSPSGFNNIWSNDSPPYTAAPIECLVEHLFYLWVAGAWGELTMLSYKGKIQNIEYDEIADQGGIRGAIATIDTEQVGISDVFKRVWQDSDGDDNDTTVDITPAEFA